MLELYLQIRNFLLRIRNFHALSFEFSKSIISNSSSNLSDYVWISSVHVVHYNNYVIMIKLNHYIQIILIIKQNQFILSAFWSKQKKVLQKFTYYHCSNNFSWISILTHFRISVFSTVWIAKHSFGFSAVFSQIRSKHLKKAILRNNHFQSV